MPCFDLSFRRSPLRASSLQKYPLPQPSLTLEQINTTRFLNPPTLYNQKKETLYMKHMAAGFLLARKDGFLQQV